MKKIIFAILVFLACLAQVFAQSASTVPGEVLVKLEAGYSPEKLTDEVYNQFGLECRFATLRCVSDYMDIWLFSFDENLFNKSDMLRFISTVDGVEVAQANHVIEERIIPDDPFFNLQWHHQDAEDNDIDSELAWEITTGGITATADDIVVCIVEIGGAKWDTPDILDNHWVNENEIPGNGIDDDENGYIDDYDGWNTNALNDNLSTGDHGTRVSSMIGSKGNNASGVTGVNWDVSMMQVQIGGSNEASAIAGYEYPLIMRKLYNETNGAKGAFVVATNSSWGTNNGQPDNAPLWCAMYDSLGYYGVLSCGATTNSNANVDVVGDLPTACPSDFMVSVGRTNSDDVRNSGGFGLTTIDLMAPGDNVYLANNTAYGNTTGTSFSSPCVAGGIALLYSAPCNSLMQFVNVDPAEAALQIKDLLLSGIDATDQLQTECVSGGRFNVNNSLQLLLESCDNSACIAPFGIVTEQIGNTLNYLISWDALPGIQNYDLQYKATASSEWTIVENLITSDFQIDDLPGCESYEVQIRSTCEEGESNWSSSFFWITDGCCVNPQAAESISVAAETAQISWEPILAATSYYIVATPETGESITFENISQTTYTLNNLLPCMRYSIEVLTNCEDNAGETVPFEIHTGGCDNCDDLTYCDASANSNSEHIAQVAVGDLNHTSESDGGYILVEDATTTLHEGSVYTITCVPGYSGASYNENFKAWIDYNSDEDFNDAGELIFDAPAPATSGVSGEFTIPETITPGIVRLRVAMAYTPSTSNVEPSECGEWTFGEVEDYCVMLDGPVGVNEVNQRSFSIFPNPVHDQITVVMHQDLKGKNAEYRLIKMDGRIIQTGTIFDNQTLDCSQLSSGLYLLELSSDGNARYTRFIKD
jgi:serine protease